MAIFPLLSMVCICKNLEYSEEKQSIDPHYEYKAQILMSQENPAVENKTIFWKIFTDHVCSTREDNRIFLQKAKLTDLTVIKCNC